MLKNEQKFVNSYLSGINVRWTDIDEIVEILEETYPEEDVHNIRFTKLQKYVVNLLDFDDDPSKCNERILENIQGQWLELREDYEEEDDEDEEY